MSNQNQGKNITREDAAISQLETAIKLYFESRDLISAHTLASASANLLKDMYEKEKNHILRKQIENGRKENLLWGTADYVKFKVKDEFHKDFFNLLNKAQNFFKHADKDPAEFIEVKEDETLFKIFFACWDYMLIYEHPTPAINTFLAWIGAYKPDIIKESPRHPAFENALEYIREFYQKNGKFKSLRRMYDTLKMCSPHLFIPSEKDCLETFSEAESIAIKRKQNT